jgi:Uncharacterised methyltransferase family (DUF6094)
MSHIGNKLLSGFFAFPERQGEYLSQLLKQEKGKAAWLDPTCGEGKILHQLATALQSSEEIEIETYGVEIDKGRAAAAEQLLDTVLNCPIESMVIQNNAFSFIFLNPPYDHTVKGIDDNKSMRKEFIELQRATRYLQPGGLLAYVIPSYRFADKQIARFLATHFERSAIMRFTDEDYHDFKQCVFLGHKKSSVVKSVNEKMMEFLLNMESEEFVMDNVSPISEFIGAAEWTIPITKNPIKTFYSRIENKKDYYEGILKSTGFEAFKNRTKPKELKIGGQPILPLNAGQMALLLASGAVNGLIGSGEKLHLVQGMEIVGTKTETEEIVSPKGNVSTKIVETTTRTVSVKLLTPKGVIKKLM